MGSPILDLNSLQATAPLGQDPSEDSSPNSPYWSVYNLRELAFRMEKETAAATDGEPDRTSLPQWRKVQEAACQALTKGCWHFKMLGWLVEALVRIHGYAGLRDGFLLSREMIDQHWSELYPPTTDGAGDRVAPLAGLNGGDREGPLPGLVRRIALLPEGVGGFGLVHYVRAREIEATADPETRARMESQPGAVTMQQLAQAASQTPREFVDELSADMEACEQAFEALWQVLEERCREESPGFPPSSHIRNALTEAREALGHLFPYLRRAAPEEAGDNNGSTPVGNNGGAGLAASVGGREQAFQKLMEVASFIRQAEPHSPVPYLLDLAVRWGRTPLHTLLLEPSTHELLSKLVETQQPASSDHN